MVEKECNPHPNAPHGFLRQASHNAGRYVCECEWWDENEYNLSIDNILEGEKITVDDTTEYSLSTHEKQAEFAKNRNYTYEVDMNAIMIEALQELNLKVEALRARVEHMEKCPWDEWKSNRDIV